MSLKGKVAIVTGASTGIGLALAKLLTKEGVLVALVSRSTDKLKKLSKELPGSLATTCDMTKASDIKKMVKQVKDHFGKIDILVNNAGQGYDASIEEINIETFYKIFDLDVVGPLIAMQQVIPLMRKQGGGNIVNVSSGTALMALPNMAGYSSLKRALVGLSLTAREELSGDNITVSVVYPYITLTNFEENTIREAAQQEWSGDGPFHPPDSAEFIAKKIIDGIKSGDAEIYAHDWMRKMK